MKKAVFALVQKIEDSYGDRQFEVLSIVKNAETGNYTVEVKEIPAEEDK